MKKNRFKTVKLLIVFILIVIVIINVVKYINKEIHKKENDDIVTNMLIIQGKTRLINGEAEVSNNKDNYVGAKLSEYQDQSLRDFTRGIGIEESSFEDFYVLNREHLSSMGILGELKNVKDYEYIVNYKDKEVIYINGIYVDNNVKYKLSDIINKEVPKKWILYNRIGE